MRRLPPPLTVSCAGRRRAPPCCSSTRPSRLERDAVELATLDRRWQEREVGRLVGRHGGSADLGAMLFDPRRHGPDLPGRVALIARFLAGDGS
jgi:hypothetical protein